MSLGWAQCPLVYLLQSVFSEIVSENWGREEEDGAEGAQLGPLLLVPVSRHCRVH